MDKRVQEVTFLQCVTFHETLARGEQHINKRNDNKIKKSCSSWVNKIRNNRKRSSRHSYRMFRTCCKNWGTGLFILTPTQTTQHCFFSIFSPYCIIMFPARQTVSTAVFNASASSSCWLAGWYTSYCPNNMWEAPLQHKYWSNSRYKPLPSISAGLIILTKALSFIAVWQRSAGNWRRSSEWLPPGYHEGWRSNK